MSLVARNHLAIAAMALMIAVAGCTPAPPDERSTPSLADLLPPVAEFADWAIADGPTEYSPDTLYEYLNGGAERYDAHGFRELLHIRYQRGEDPLASITLDVYDMGSELGAFGIYSAGRPADPEPRPWGAEGYRDGTITAAYKGSIFVHGEADDDRPELVEMLDGLMPRVTSAAEGSVSPPAIFASLPADHRSPGSERYVPENLLGHSFLPGGVLATYEIDGRRAELFFSDLCAETEAVDAIAALRAHFAKRNSITGDTPSLGDNGFRVTDPIFGQATVVRRGNFIAGIHGDLSVEEGEAILRRLIDTAL